MSNRPGRLGELVRELLRDRLVDRAGSRSRPTASAPPRRRGSRGTPATIARRPRGARRSCRSGSCRRGRSTPSPRRHSGRRCLVLVRDEHVALTADERVQRVTRARVLNDRVLAAPRSTNVQRLLLGRAVVDRLAVRGHDVPAGAARGERVRGHDFDVIAHEVLPALDVLRVARPHAEGDDRRLHDAAVRPRSPRSRGCTRPASTRRVMSGSIGRWTNPAGWPASTARDWSPDEPNDAENSTPSPSGVAWNAGIRSSSYAVCGVEYATRSMLPPEPEPPSSLPAASDDPPHAATPIGRTSSANAVANLLFIDCMVQILAFLDWFS